MRRIIILLVAVALLNGCALSLPSNFVERAKIDLSTTLLLYKRADWLKGVFGYQSMFTQRPNPVGGALVCGDEVLMFVVLDKSLGKYISVLDLRFKDDLKNVSVGKWGQGRRLILYGKQDVYTFEIIKQGGMIDRTMTYSFAIFVADKLGQESQQFTKEFKKEKEIEEEEAARVK